MKKNKTQSREDFKLDLGAKSAMRILNDTKPIGNQTRLVVNENGTGEVHLDEKSMKRNSKFIVNTRLR